MSPLSREGGMRAADRLIGAARNNPEGVLLLAAGCALLMRGVGAAAHALRDDQASARPNSRGNGSRRSAPSGSDDDDAMGLVGTARERAANLAGQVKERAGHFAEYANEARNAAYGQSGEMARQAGSSVRDAVDRMVKEQPLTIALFGLAAGAVLAGTLPASRAEERALAPAAEGLGDVARGAKSRLRKSAARARERMNDVAEERGLTAEGLKQAAGEVAEAFGSELMGETEAPRAGARKATSRSRPAAARAAQPRARKAAQRKASSGTSSSDTRSGTPGPSDNGGQAARAVPSTGDTERGV